MPFLSVHKLADADFPTRWGHFRILGFEGVVDHPQACNEDKPAPATRTESAVALVMGDIHAAPPVVRIHSQCLTGDVFHSLRCDCRQQLELALATIADEGAGILLYENQEGRGIGLMAKLQASTPLRPTSNSDTLPTAATSNFPQPFLDCSTSTKSASSPTIPRRSRRSSSPASE
jgi:GTP cyclohydrolase II